MYYFLSSLGLPLVIIFFSYYCCPSLSLISLSYIIIYFYFYYFYFLLRYSWHISFRCMTLWFNIYIPYELMTKISLVTICHHTKLPQYYWLDSLCCTFHSMTYFVTGSLYYFMFFTCFAHTLTSPIPTPLATTSLFSLIYESVYVLFCLFICFVF